MEQGGIYAQRESNHLQKAERSESAVRPSRKMSVAQSGGTRKPVGEEWHSGMVERTRYGAGQADPSLVPH